MDLKISMAVCLKKNGHYNDLEVKHSRLLDDRVISVQLINSALHLLEVVF